MTLFKLYATNNDMTDETVISVHTFNDFDNTGCLYLGKWKDMPEDFYGYIVRCFGTLDNGEIYIELEPGEENL